MSTAMTLKFVTSVALYVQLLILIYLYSSHRARFFRYLVWAWSLFVVSKGSYMVQQFLPGAAGVLPFLNAAGSAGDLLILAAGLAYWRDYRIRWYHAALGVAYAVASGFLSHPSEVGMDMSMARRVVGGGALIAAGLAFWPQRAMPSPQPGAKFLAISLGLWGLHRVVMAFVDLHPGSSAFMLVSIMLSFFYFSSALAIIVLVLNRARSEVASLEEFNKRLVDGLGEGLEVVDGDFTVRHANRWMAQQFGPVAGRRCYEVLTADGRPCPSCPLGRRAELDAPARLEVAGLGDRRFLLTCSPVRQPDGQIFLLELVADVTEQERLRARLTAAERLAAVGEVAAGLAHEIRNPLAAILNTVTLLEQEETLTADERASILEAVKTEARRLNTTLSDFLLFARPRELKRQKGDVRQLVEHVAALLQEERTRPGGLQVDVRLDPTIPPFAFDPDQLTQVLWNIALNGVEAMEGQGRLTLDVYRQNGAVMIAVTDTGRGILPEERWRIFQPFFSKKPGGTGLGLAIAQRIVAAHGGRIDVDSTPEQGSRFTISLPVGEG
jgi:two-component system, NtrC family, sensor histidine kinase HydH